MSLPVMLLPLQEFLFLLPLRYRLSFSFSFTLSNEISLNSPIIYFPCTPFIHHTLTCKFKLRAYTCWTFFCQVYCSQSTASLVFFRTNVHCNVITYSSMFFNPIRCNGSALSFDAHEPAAHLFVIKLKWSPLL